MSGLFKSSEIEVADNLPQEASSYVHEDSSLLILDGARETLNKIIKHANAGHTIHFASAGVFSMHDLLRRLLELQGPSKVYLTTWAMTEIPVRSIKLMIDSGLITELNCLFDFKIRKNSPKAMQLAQGIATKIHLAHCHAKATVLINEHAGTTIIGSANYTRNPRMEAGIVSFDLKVAEFHRDWIMHEINNTTALNAEDETE
jgi:hypothetical protein